MPVIINVGILQIVLLMQKTKNNIDTKIGIHGYSVIATDVRHKKLVGALHTTSNDNNNKTTAIINRHILVFFVKQIMTYYPFIAVIISPQFSTSQVK